MKNYLFIITGIFLFILSIHQLSAAKESDTSLYYNIGLLKTIQNNYPQAINAYCMAVKTEKNNPEIYLNLADVCLKFINSPSSDPDQDSARIDKYYNLGIVSIRMTDQLLADYKKGKAINLFTKSLSHEKVIKNLEIRLSQLRSLYNKFKDKIQSQEKETVKILAKNEEKKPELKNTVKPDKQSVNKKTVPDNSVQISDNKQAQTVQTTGNIENKTEPVKEEPVLDNKMLNSYLLTNRNINNDREYYSREITDLKKELIVLIKEYMEQSDNKEEDPKGDNKELQNKINSLKQQIYQMEKEHQEQIAVLKQKISESEKNGKVYKEDEEEEEKPSKGFFNNVLFGGLIVVTLLMVAII